MLLGVQNSTSQMIGDQQENKLVILQIPSSLCMLKVETRTLVMVYPAMMRTFQFQVLYVYTL
jgi:hypothetical protein